MGKHQDIHNEDVPKLCRSCEARHRGICGALTSDELKFMSKQTRRVQHEAGTELIGDSEPISSYSNVLSGVVKLTKMLEDGRQQIVGLQFAPDFLGRLFSAESHLGAEAASDVELCHMPKSAIESLTSQNPAFEHKLHEQTLKSLDEARDWMMTLGRKTAAEKVASFLYLVAVHIDPLLEKNHANTTTFDLPLTRADIADFLGLTVETVSRQLTKLRADKVIEITANRHVFVPDIKRLCRRSG